MHRVDLEVIFLAVGAEDVDEVIERDAEFRDVDEHDHREVVLHDALRDVDNVRPVFVAFRAYFGYDPYVVPARDRYDSVHQRTPRVYVMFCDVCMI